MQYFNKFCKQLGVSMAPQISIGSSQERTFVWPNKMSHFWEEV